MLPPVLKLGLAREYRKLQPGVKPFSIQLFSIQQVAGKLYLQAAQKDSEAKHESFAYR